MAKKFGPMRGEQGSDPQIPPFGYAPDHLGYETLFPNRFYHSIKVHSGQNIEEEMTSFKS